MHSVGTAEGAGVAEKPTSKTAEWLGVLAGVLALIAAFLAAGHSILGYDTPRAMVCDLTGTWCKAPPAP